MSRRPKPVLSDPALFKRKIVRLVLATVALVPLIYFKLSIPALVYVTVLLVLHLYFLWVYFSRLPWRQLWSGKAQLLARLTSVVFFTFILASLRFSGSPGRILLSLVIATLVHAAILLALMLKFEPAAIIEP